MDKQIVGFWSFHRKNNQNTEYHQSRPETLNIYELFILIAEVGNCDVLIIESGFVFFCQ